MKKLILSILLVLFTISLTSCTDPLDSHYDLFFATVIYSTGEQNIDIKVFENKKDSIEFLDTISVNDLELFGVLASKKIDDVSYQNKHCITIKLTGSCSTDIAFKSGIIVKASGLNREIDSAAAVKEIYEPSPYVTNYGKIEGLFGNIITADLLLPLDNTYFISENISSSICLLNQYNGTLEVSYRNSRCISVTITGFTKTEEEEYPILVFNNNSTSINKRFEVKVLKLEIIESPENIIE